MSTMTPVSKNDPMLHSWEAFKVTEEYANAKKWAGDPNHLEGSLWAVYIKGYQDRASQAPRSDLLKILDALRAVRRFLRLRDEMNAEVHLARETRYSPLTNEVDAQCDRLHQMLESNPQ